MNKLLRLSLCATAILITHINILPFDNLAHLLKYVDHVAEFPDSDLDLKGVLAQTNPTFHIFYPTIDQGFFGRLACRLHIYKPLWCFADFENAIEDLYQQGRERLGLHQNTVVRSAENINNISNYIIGCTATEGMEIIIVGELSGAVHSLARIIQHWNQIGIMDENFILKDAKTKIVFLGNVVGTSAYNLEILTLIATIMKRNPQKVWCLCGITEDKQRWHETPLHHAIQVRSHYNKQDLRHIYQLVDNAFYLLPKSLVITSHSRDKAIICAEKPILDKLDINDIYNCCYHRFVNPEIEICNLESTKKIENKPVSIMALIENRRNWSTAVLTDPVEKQVIQNIQGTGWNIVSGTTRALLSTYLLRWCGYCVLKIHSTDLSDSTLEYIGQHVRLNQNFQTRAVYNLTSGEILDSSRKSTNHAS
jgi:hypothetical protein